MKRSFIRGIWGVHDIKHELGRWYSRRAKIDNDILLAKLNPYAPSCRVYIFGEENYKILTDMGFDSVLIDKKPFCWDMTKEQYRHKIEIWKYGLIDFDEIVFLDWDCIPLAPIPQDFWEVLGRGEKIRATIYLYTLPRVLFRSPDIRKVSSSTFVYIRGEEIANDIIKVWEDTGRSWQEEIALSKYIDNLSDGWRGINYYKNRFEPPYHTLFFHYDADYIKNVMIPHNIFYHLNHHVVSALLGNKNQKIVKENIDNLYKKKKEALEMLWKRKVQKQTSL